MFFSGFELFELLNVNNDVISVLCAGPYHRLSQ